MELQSSKETFLRFQSDYSSALDDGAFIDEINGVIKALIDLRESLLNSVSICVTVEALIGVDGQMMRHMMRQMNADFLKTEHEPDAVSDDGDYADNSAIWPDPPTAVVIDGNQYRIGDEITVINPEARIGNTNLQYRTGKIAKLPNHNTEMFMVQFDGISADVAMRRDEFRVYLPF